MKRTALFSSLFIVAFSYGGEQADNAADIGGATFRRAEVFSFAREPQRRKLGANRYEISFVAQGACDATVGIVNAEGRIVRHLASGVLGANAPEPFQKSSLEQKLEWDGRDDFGKPVADTSACKARVSLGLKPVFDKALLWHPNYGTVKAVACDKEGVYVYDAHISQGGERPFDQLKAYDHEGRYRKTLCPQPHDKITPDRHPMLEGMSDPAAKPRYPAFGPPYALRLPDGRLTITGNFVGSLYSSLEPCSLAASGGVLIAVTQDPRLHFFRLGADGSTPESGLLSEPLGARPSAKRGDSPCWLAHSPDGKWLYLSGLGVLAKDPAKGARHAIYRLPADYSAGLSEPFLGAAAESGNAEGRFNAPSGIATAPDGRIYVADFGNDRIQVFASDGRFVAALNVAGPRHVAVHPKTGDLYVVACPLEAPNFRLVKLEGASGKEISARTFELPLAKNPKARQADEHQLPAFCFDPFAAEPTVWITNGEGALQLWTDKGERFELKRDLRADLFAELPGFADVDGNVRSWGGPLPIECRGKPIVDPLEPYVYLTQRKLERPYGSFPLRGTGLRVHLETGRIEQSAVVWTFGPDGTAYGIGNGIERYERETWKPVPVEGSFRPPAHHPFAVAPDGGFACHLGGHGLWNKDAEPYPGRMIKSGGYILRTDARGQIVSKDLLQGVPLTSAGMEFDLAGNLYVVLPLYKYVNGNAVQGFSLLKFPPTGGRFLIDGKGVPVPLETPPARAPDFLHRLGNEGDAGPDGETRYGNKCWAEGMLWSVVGYSTMSTGHCTCTKGNFALDLYARSYIPEGHRQSVFVVDTNGNFILRLGSYGNADAQGPEVRLAYARNVGVNDRRLLIADAGSRRLVCVSLAYETERELAVQP